MTYEEFIERLEEIGACYQVYDAIPGRVQVYIHDKGLFQLKKKHPRKYKDLYIPYLRVSGFEDGNYYVRDNGWCQYMPEERIMEIVNDLTQESA